MSVGDGPRTGRLPRPPRVDPHAATVPPEVWQDDQAPKRRPNTCGHCDTTWTGLSVAHCGGCHETFAAVSLFDLHRVDGRCVQPVLVSTRGGERRLLWRDGMWRGPEMPPDARAAFAKEAS